MVVVDHNDVSDCQNQNTPVTINSQITRLESPGGVETLAHHLSRLRLLVGLGLSAVTGCSYTYTDAQGGLHAFGFVSILVRPSPDSGLAAGNVIEVSSIGVAMGSTAQGGYLSVGYTRQATAVLRDNVLVIGNPLAVLEPNAVQPPADGMEKK